MEQITYVLQFTGHAAPVEGSSGVLKATTTAPSCDITTHMGPHGVRTELRPGEGSRAQFESEVTMTGDASFKESGSISFGEGGKTFVGDSKMAALATQMSVEPRLFFRFRAPVGGNIQRMD